MKKLTSWVWSASLSRTPPQSSSSTLATMIWSFARWTLIKAPCLWLRTILRSRVSSRRPSSSWAEILRSWKYASRIHLPILFCEWLAYVIVRKSFAGKCKPPSTVLRFRRFLIGRIGPLLDFPTMLTQWATKRLWSTTCLKRTQDSTLKWTLKMSRATSTNSASPTVATCSS